MRKIPYAQRLAEYQRRKMQEICKCPAKETALLHTDLALQAEGMSDLEAQYEWYTNLITVDNELAAVVSEIDSIEVLTVKNTN